MNVRLIRASASSATRASGRADRGCGATQPSSATETGAEPLAGRACWAVVALIVVIATDIPAIVSDWLEIRLMNRLVAGDDVSAESLDSNDTRQLAVASIAFVAFGNAIVLFLR